MSIRILPTEVASQIAAGEVIERPASVVKELIENALDAGASDIRIAVMDAGRSLVEVGDNGSGIPSEEISLAVERNATSKLSQAEDLFKIATLGFRGEALASVGSVSRMTITSRCIAEDLGALLHVEGGKVFEVQPFGGPVGTVVRVENLFFNVPARLKFLKTDPTERRLITILTARYAMAYPLVRFKLAVEDRPVLQTSGNGSRREILSMLYDPQVARQMIEVLYKDQDVEINGFISPTSVTRTHRREIHFFVNGRPIQDVALSAALLKGFHTLLMVGRYPLATLLLKLDPELVDVNVHPTKAEVRFREQERVFSIVQNAVRRALLANNPIQDLTDALPWTSRPGQNFQHSTKLIDPAWEQHRSNPLIPQMPPVSWAEEDRSEAPMAQNTSSDVFEQREMPGVRVPILRPVGQVASAYLVAEGPDGLYLIDQHAAHERILYERFMSQGETSLPTQTLLQPVLLELNSSSAQLLEEQLPTLNRLGFFIEPFGPHAFMVRRIPAILSGSDPGAALRSLVEKFEEDESAFQNQAEARLIARICKRSAIKAGATLSPDEQRVLLNDLENCQSPRTCPHGRPTMIHLSVDLLERQFGRRGAR